MSEPSPNRRYYLVAVTTVDGEPNSRQPDISGIDSGTVSYLSDQLCIVRDPDGVLDLPFISTASTLPDDLPLQVPVDITQGQVNALCAHFGVTPMSLGLVAAGRAGGK